MIRQDWVVLSFMVISLSAWLVGMISNTVLVRAGVTNNTIIRRVPKVAAIVFIITFPGYFISIIYYTH